VTEFLARSAFNIQGPLMAALVLSVAGAAIGGAVFGPVGAIAGLGVSPGPTLLPAGVGGTTPSAGSGGNGSPALPIAILAIVGLAGLAATRRRPAGRRPR